MLGGISAVFGVGVEVGEQLQTPRVQHRGASRDDGPYQPILAPEVVLRCGGIARGCRLSDLAERDCLDPALGEEALRDDDELLGRRPTVGAPGGWAWAAVPSMGHSLGP